MTGDHPIESEAPDATTRAERFARGGDLGAVAATLREQRHEILARWLDSSARQPFHAGRPTRGVADHVPFLFDAVVSLLEVSAP